MLDTLSAANPSVTWIIDGGPTQMTFNHDGTGSIGKYTFNYSIGASGNPDFPLAFIAQSPHPIMQQVYQVWSGMVNASAGGGLMTDGWGSGQPGTLAAFSMAIAP